MFTAVVVSTHDAILTAVFFRCIIVMIGTASGRAPPDKVPFLGGDVYGVFARHCLNCMAFVPYGYVAEQPRTLMVMKHSTAAFKPGVLHSR